MSIINNIKQFDSRNFSLQSYILLNLAMMQDSGNYNKKRRLEGFDTYGCNDYDGIMHYQTESRKWTLPVLVRLIESQGYTDIDISKFCQQRRYEKSMMKLVSSDCFSVFLTYLDIKKIVRLDSAFCNHVDRPKWLNSLKNFKPSISIRCNRSTIKVAK